MLQVLRFLQTVDRRFLYALLMLVVVIPFFVTIKLPVKINPNLPSVKLYNAIEALPEGSFVLFGVDWGAGTRGENRAHTEAFMHHLMRKKLRFGLLAFDPQAKKLSQNIALRLEKQYGYEYGKNWVNFGYKVDQENYLKAFGPDVIGQVKVDINGTPLEQLPVMQGIKTAKDFSMMLDVTGSGTYETYIQFLQGPYQLKMGLGTTSVMAPEAFNRIDAGQIVGMMPGLTGALEYETMLGIPGKATSASNSSNFAHLLVITFLVLGNVAMVLERGLRAAGEDAVNWLETNKDTLSLIIGAICTLGLYSILYRENKIYRFFEHLFLGLATGYLVANVWTDTLQPKWWEPFKWWTVTQNGQTTGGQWWLIFVLIAGLFYYFIYSQKFNWLARLIIGFTLGATSGRAFQGFVNDFWPQIPTSFKPIIPHGEITTAAGTKIPELAWSGALNNLIFMIILFCVMSYFFFSFEQKNPVLKGSAKLGRWLMMFAFGAIFGSTIMGRLALMIDRMDYLVNDFGVLLGGPKVGPYIMFAVLIGLAGLILYLAKRAGARADEPGTT